MSAGIEPGDPPTHDNHPYFAFIQIIPVQIGYFNLTASGRLKSTCIIDDLFIIKIYPRNGITRSGDLGFS